MGKLYLFGEDHTNLAEIDRINNRIREIRPDFLLHELLYSDVCLTLPDIQSRLRNCKSGELCDPSLNKDIYELGAELFIPIIGIDLEVSDQSLSLKQQFAIRERHMVNMIERYRLKGSVVVVVGDSHLRTQRTTALGDPSPIAQLFANRAIIERSQSGRYSPETSHPSWLQW